MQRDFEDFPRCKAAVASLGGLEGRSRVAPDPPADDPAVLPCPSSRSPGSQEASHAPLRLLSRTGHVTESAYRWKDRLQPFRHGSTRGRGMRWARHLVAGTIRSFPRGERERWFPQRIFLIFSPEGRVLPARDTPLGRSSPGG